MHLNRSTKKSLIPSKQYKKIVELVPLLCVDIVLTYKGKYVLVKRNNEPLKGMWWVVGGRAMKDERLHTAAKRKVKEETNLPIGDLHLMGVYEESYKKSAWGIPTHTVSIIYHAEVLKFYPLLDAQSSGIKLFDDLPERFMKHYEEI